MDVRIVIAVTISIISVVQYYSSWTNYEDAIKYIMTVPKYRIKATEIAKEDGLLKSDKKANRGKTKEQLKKDEEDVLRKVRDCAMDVYPFLEKFDLHQYFINFPYVPVARLGVAAVKNMPPHCR